MAKHKKVHKSLIKSINTTKEYEVTYYIPSLTAEDDGCTKERTFAGVSKSDVETKFYDWLESKECPLPEPECVYHLSIDKVRSVSK